MSDTRFIAKLTRPVLTQICRRDRLNTLFDSRPDERVTWLFAPGGSGKTTAVVDYLDQKRFNPLWYRLDEGDGDMASFFYFMSLALKKAVPRDKKPLPLFTPEYQMGIPAFTRRFFETLFSRLKVLSAGEVVLVLDNYQDVPAGSGFHAMIVHAFESIPEGMRVAVISRYAPPPTLSRLLISRRMREIGWDELRFNYTESAALCRLQNGNITPQSIDRICQSSGGWAAAIVLIAAQASQGIDAKALSADTNEQIFDYLAGEVFDRTDGAVQNLLLKTAFLPRFTAAQAQEIADEGRSAFLLDRLCRNHFFTTRHVKGGTVYQYHPLFGQFLAQRVQSVFSQEQIAQLKKRSAGLLSAAKEIDAAVRLLVEAGEGAPALELLLSESFELIAQGRNRTLIELIGMLPQEKVAQTPWCLFWGAMANMPFEPATARAGFIEAFNGFRSADNRDGMLRCWSALVETVFFEWDTIALIDPWVKWLEEFFEKKFAITDADLNLQVSAAMTAALTMRGGGDPGQLRKWVERTIAALVSATSPYVRSNALVYCVNYILWVRPFEMDTGTVETVLKESEQADLPPLPKLTIAYARLALDIRQMADMQTALKRVHEALKLAAKSGVHVWDEIFYGMGVYCAIMIGNRDESAYFLEKMRLCVSTARRQGLAFYYFVRAWDALVFHAPAQARSEIEKALELYAQTGYNFPSNVATYGAAVICAENGEPDAALAYALAADAVAQKHEAISMRCVTLLILAYVRVKRGEVEMALEPLAGALAIARRGNFLRPVWWWYGPMMSTLAALAIEKKIEEPFAVLLVQKLQLSPPVGEVALSAWPWPVKIFLLGRFEVRIHNKPLEFSGKTPKKPLELLRAVAASGAEGANTYWLIDQLWPGVEEAKARHALEMALHRLRKILGREDILTVQAGQIRLNDAVCVADCRIFSDRAQMGVKAVRNGETERGMKMLNEAVNHYGGLLYDHNGADCWAVLFQERLEEKYRQAVTITNR